MATAPFLHLTDLGYRHSSSLFAVQLCTWQQLHFCTLQTWATDIAPVCLLSNCAHVHMATAPFLHRTDLGYRHSSNLSLYLCTWPRIWCTDCYGCYGALIAIASTDHVTMRMATKSTRLTSSLFATGN